MQGKQALFPYRIFAYIAPPHSANLKAKYELTNIEKVYSVMRKAAKLKGENHETDSCSFSCPDPGCLWRAPCSGPAANGCPT
jgi:hypothetical protein